MVNRGIFKDFCLSVGTFIIFLSTPSVFAKEKLEGKTTSTQKSVIDIPTKKAAKKIAPQCVAAPSLQPYILDPTISAAMGTKTKLSADKTHGNRAKMTLEGNVQIISASESVKADKIIYDEKANRLSFSGNVIISNKDTVIQAESGFKQIRGDYGELEESKYYFPGRNARGSAKNITMESKTTYKLNLTTYTICSPQSNVWQLKASSLKLD